MRRALGRSSRCLAGAALTALFLTPAFAGDTPEADDGMDVFFRESDLEALAAQVWAEYPAGDPGENEPFGRAFEGAPPMIPHSVADMLPITGSDNVCIECHHPDEAEGAEAPAMSVSHFKRPKVEGGVEPAKDDGSGMLVRIVDYGKADSLTGFQFNCVQCHTPQATNVVDIVNTFTGGPASR